MTMAALHLITSFLMMALFSAWHYLLLMLYGNNALKKRGRLLTINSTG